MKKTEKKVINRDMTKEEIRNVKCFDDLMFRKGKRDGYAVLTADFENGNGISYIQILDWKTKEPTYWDCMVSIVTDKETNEVITEHHQIGEYCIELDDKDELLRIFILNRDYTYTTEIIHTLIKTSK